MICESEPNSLYCGSPSFLCEIFYYIKCQKLFFSFCFESMGCGVSNSMPESHWAISEEITPKQCSCADKKPKIGKFWNISSKWHILGFLSAPELYFEVFSSDMA